MPSTAHIIRRRRNRKQRRARVQERNQWITGGILGLIATFTLVPALGLLVLALALYSNAAGTMPTPAQTMYIDPIIGPTRFLDRTGETLLYSVQDPLGDERRWIDIRTLPDEIIDATIHMEDPDYFAVPPSDAVDALERIWRYIFGISTAREASLAGTFAQKVLVPQSDESGIDPALLQIVYTAQLNRTFSREEVVEWYLNTNYYGNDAYGIEAAARVYFGKSAAALTLDEAAMLAAISPAPRYNPFDNLDAARGRQLDLLRRLLAADLISQEAFDSAATTRTRLNPDVARPPQIATDFSLYARQQAEQILAGLGLDGDRLISRGGLRITTTLDLPLYWQIDCLNETHGLHLQGDYSTQALTATGDPCLASAHLREVVTDNRQSLPDSASTIVLDVTSGEVLAMTGSPTESSEQAGPMLQPFAYLAGFLYNNDHAATMVLDIPHTFPGPTEGSIYEPANPGGKFHGPLNLRDAMVAGLHVPAATVADRVGLTQVLDVAHHLGVNSLVDPGLYDLSLLERGGTASLLDLSYAYSVFATLGDRRGVDVEPLQNNLRDRDPVAVLRIEDASGRLLWSYDERREASRTNILQDEFAYLINDIYADNSTRRAMLDLSEGDWWVDRPAALLSGTTADNRDTWTIGYTPQLLVGVHFDRADDAPMTLSPIYSRNEALPLWQAIMRYAHQRYAHPAILWEEPDGLVQYRVCDRSGLLPAANSPCTTRTEIFLAEAPPTEVDTYWQRLEINQQTGRLATSATPDRQVVSETFFIPPDAALTWWRESGQRLPPAEYDRISVASAFRDVEITAPADSAFVGGEVEVRGSVDTAQMSSYQLRYGVGLNPSQWFDIVENETIFLPGTPIARWNTTGLDGLYTLELVMVRADGSRESAAHQVTVDNNAPSVTLRTADNLTQVRYPAQSTLELVAEANDLAMDRVEFYQNGVLVHLDREAPYTHSQAISGAALFRYEAIAVDSVGNRSMDDLEIEVIRSGG